MTGSPHQPNRLVFVNTATGEHRTVRFASPEHHALKAQRHPYKTEDLWRQVHTPQPEGKTQ